jgi:hypothetical protein
LGFSCEFCGQQIKVGLILEISTSTMAEEGRKQGVTVRDVAAPKFIAAYADILKNNDKFVVPKWVDLVKTGVHKELAPYDPDWYYIRAGIIVHNF